MWSGHGGVERGGVPLSLTGAQALRHKPLQRYRPAAHFFYRQPAARMSSDPTRTVLPGLVIAQRDWK